MDTFPKLFTFKLIPFLSLFLFRSHPGFHLQLLPQTVQPAPQPLQRFHRESVIQRVRLRRLLPRFLPPEQQQHFNLQPGRRHRQLLRGAAEPPVAAAVAGLRLVPPRPGDLQPRRRHPELLVPKSSEPQRPRRPIAQERRRSQRLGAGAPALGFAQRLVREQEQRHVGLLGDGLVVLSDEQRQVQTTRTHRQELQLTAVGRNQEVRLQPGRVRRAGTRTRK